MSATEADVIMTVAQVAGICFCIWVIFGRKGYNDD